MACERTCPDLEGCQVIPWKGSQSKLDCDVCLGKIFNEIAVKIFAKIFFYLCICFVQSCCCVENFRNVCIAVFFLSPLNLFVGFMRVFKCFNVEKIERNLRF